MADENKTPEEEILDQYLQDGNFTEEQKTAVLDALIEIEKKRLNPESKNLEEEVLNTYLKNQNLTEEQEAIVLDAMINVEKQRLAREAAEIADNLNNLSAEEVEKLAAVWARTPGADDLRTKIAARQEELRANTAPKAADENEAVSNPEESKKTSESASVQETPQAEVSKEAEQPVSNASSAPKADVSAGEAPADDVSSEKSEINQYNAVEKAKNLKNLLPSQLATLRRDLNARPNDETNAAGIKVEDHIVSEAGKYADGKLPLTNIDEVYALNDLLVLVKAYPNSEKTKENMATVEKAITAAQSEIEVFEEEYGIDDAHLQEPQVVETNISGLDGMPKDSDLFALDVHEEKLQQATEYQDVVGILNSAQQSGKVPEISVLAGALQCKDLQSDQKTALLDWAEKRVNSTNSLGFNDFKNFEYLLKTLRESPNANNISSVLKKKEKLLADARQAYVSNVPLKTPEFQDVYNILNNLTVAGELKTFSREKLDQKGSDSDIALFLEQTRRETETYLANTGKTVTPEAFQQEYADRLRKNIVEVVCADQFSKGRVSEKDYTAMFNKLAAAAQRKKGIAINQDSFIGWQAAKTNRLQSAINRLGQKKGYEKASKSFGERLNATDKKLTQKYGKKYSLLKGGLKTAGWGAAYGIAGTVFGPAGLAAVGVASFGWNTYKFIRDYRRERKEAIKKNKKIDNFWRFMTKDPDHLLRTASVLLSGATAAIGIGGAIAPAAVVTARVGSRIAGFALAGVSALNESRKAYQETKGTAKDKRKAAYKALGVSLASFGIGFATGKAVGGMFNHNSMEVDANKITDDQTKTMLQNMDRQDQQRTGVETQHSEIGLTETPAPEAPVVDAPAIDLNNLTVEQQHDLQMLFSRDPAEANMILGLNGDQWMNSEQLQTAWNDGTFTPEQKALLIEFGGQRFDEHGNFQDVEGYKPADEMEAEAKEWTEKHSNTEQRDNTSPDIMPDALSAEDVEVKQIINDRESGITTIISEGPNGEQLSTTVPLDESPLKHLDSVQYNDDGSINVSRTLEDGTEMTGTIYQGDKVDEYTFSRDGMTFTDTNDWNLDEGKGAYESLMGDRTEASQTVADNYNAENGIKSEATEHTSENTGRTSTEKAVHSTTETEGKLNDKLGLTTEVKQPEAPQLQATEVEQPATPTNEARESDVEVNKIKINDDKVKIVGQTDDGRIVARTDTEALQSHGLPDDYDYKNIQYADNGDISFRMQGENGNTIAITLDEDGHYKSINTGSKEYTPEEIKYINNEMDQHPDALQRNLDQYKSLQTLRDNLEEGLDLSNKTPQPQATEVKQPEAPKAEAQAQTRQEAPEKTMTDTQERSETGGMDIQTNVQVTQEGDTIHTHTDTQTTMSDNTELSSGLKYYEIQSEAAEQLGLYQDAQTGVYTYGLGQSHDIETAQTEHDLAMRDAYINHEVLQGLEAKGDNLTSEESALKDQCLQKQKDYAERGLTIDENGKPVFDDKLLNRSALEERNAERVAEAEQNMAMKDIDVSKAAGGDLKISGQINGQEIEGRMNENGEFEKLSIDGKAIRGDELEQYNADHKINNQALHNIVSDEGKLNDKLGLTTEVEQPATPTAEARAPTGQEAPEKPMTDTQERSETGGMDIQTNVQVTQEGDTIHTHTDTQTTMSDNTELSSGLKYYEIQSEAAEQLGLYQDAQTGVYTYGLGQSHDIETAQTEHDLAMRDAYINHEVLQGLEAKGDNLTSEESALKDQCLQKQKDYAERGLTIDENGKPVFDDKLLNRSALEERNAERVAEAEQNMAMKDIDVSKAAGGDLKISGQINGQEIEGRMNENGEFEKLSIDGKAIRGDELAQYNADHKINNQALHNIVSDEGKLNDKLGIENEKQTESAPKLKEDIVAEKRGIKQPNSNTSGGTKGERVVLNDAQLHQKGGRDM